MQRAIRSLIQLTAIKKGKIVIMDTITVYIQDKGDVKWSPISAWVPLLKQKPIFSDPLGAMNVKVETILCFKVHFPIRA